MPAAHLPLHNPNTTDVDRRRLAPVTREVLVATVTRHDGRWARLYNGARSICTAFTHDEPG
ncbi:hypothetical protein [Streptomyces sp. CoT10]|uniref:hypothetical protein n=1 Tax=Streptomyces sp. CoT10 TaxID=2875762 RepID=UPI001CD28638|nr:hypothetical protein [Streptomyces sp. CoT10]